VKLFFPILFFLSVYSQAQSAEAQNIFNSKIWKEVLISSSITSFFDNQNKYLGSSTETDQATIYKDRWKRVIKVVKKSRFQTEKILANQNIKSANNFSLNSNRVVLKRNKVIYFDVNGLVEVTAKRRGRRKVYFHNSQGDLIGYKLYKSDGTILYKDNWGRITGKSYVDRSGRMIYRPKNRKRRTSRVLFEDPFLFK
tara:strand:+ start:5028 stop:5618 length:591 start_codon:yes stop_codon:yes gene_type:complete